MIFFITYRGQPVQILPHHNFSIVPWKEATPFRSKRAARLAAKFVGIPAKDRKIEPLNRQQKELSI